PRLFSPKPQTDILVTSKAIERMRQQPDYRLLDSRTSERFRGENETIDPVAGHIPGAISAPYLDNLDNKGQFHSPNVLKKRFEKLLAGVTPERAIFYCGSGVTAAHNLLAQLHSGMGEGKLYAGSWSEWITDPKRPVTNVQNASGH
ncbi:MAG: sulfurtransferase, partial [Anaerolineales bacterium]